MYLKQCLTKRYIRTLTVMLAMLNAVSLTPFRRTLLRYVRFMHGPSVLLSVCLSSVTLLRPTHRVKVFGNVLRGVIAQVLGQFLLKFWKNNPRGF